MRARSLFAFLLVVAMAAGSAVSFVGAHEETAEGIPADTRAAVENEAESAELEVAADAFLDQSVITITPVHTVYCPCQVGVNCCGDPGVDITCSTSNHCVCDAQDDCILQHIHRRK